MEKPWYLYFWVENVIKNQSFNQCDCVPKTNLICCPKMAIKQVSSTGGIYICIVNFPITRATDNLEKNMEILIKHQLQTNPRSNTNISETVTKYSNMLVNQSL